MNKGFKKEKLTGEIRLNKYLSDAGICSRREADRLIELGKVYVDGIVAIQGMKIMPNQKVEVKGQKVEREKEMILLAVNKPRGVVCTTDNRWGDKTVYDMLDFPKRVFSIGRLDKDSEGLLLMTNNGDILNKIMRAGNYHEKEYLVTVNREITPEFLKKMAAGVYLKELEVKTRPCKVELAGKCQIRITLTQGLNRQIRRMCEALGYKVTRLLRVRIMNIELGNLKPGEYRSITRKELAVLNEQLKDSVSAPNTEQKSEIKTATVQKAKNNTTIKNAQNKADATKKTEGNRFQKTEGKQSDRKQFDKKQGTVKSRKVR